MPTLILALSIPAPRSAHTRRPIRPLLFKRSRRLEWVSNSPGVPLHPCLFGPSKAKCSDVAPLVKASAWAPLGLASLPHRARVSFSPPCLSGARAGFRLPSGGLLRSGPRRLACTEQLTEHICTLQCCAARGPGCAWRRRRLPLASLPWISRSRSVAGPRAAWSRGTPRGRCRGHKRGRRPSCARPCRCARRSHLPRQCRRPRRRGARLRRRPRRVPSAKRIWRPAASQAPLARRCRLRGRAVAMALKHSCGPSRHRVC